MIDSHGHLGAGGPQERGGNGFRTKTPGAGDNRGYDGEFGARQSVSLWFVREERKERMNPPKETEKLIKPKSSVSIKRRYEKWEKSCA